jgi:hypothetical protein
MEDEDYIMDNIDPEDLVIHPDLDKVLESHRWKWVDDALGIVPHCLQILKGCHLMSERLVTTAMASTDQQRFVELAMVQLSLSLKKNKLHAFLLLEFAVVTLQRLCLKFLLCFRLQNLSFH